MSRVAATARDAPEIDDATAVTVPGPAPDIGGRIPALDGLRGIAGLQVFVYHYLVRILDPASDPTGVLALIQRLASQLFSGVDLFFVLSGFLLTRILILNRTAPRFFSAFYARRGFRILPLYIVLLGGFVIAGTAGAARVVPGLFAGAGPTWAHVFFVQNFWMAAAGSFGAMWLAGTWSLAVEEQFYLVLPLIVRRFTMRGLARLTIACIVGAPMLRVAIQATGILPGLANYVLIFTRCDALAWGTLLAIVVTRAPALLQRTAGVLPTAAGATMGLALVIGYRPLPSFERIAAMDHSLLPFGYALIVAAVFARPSARLGRLLATRPMRKLGDWAYSNYLMHPVMLIAIVTLMTGHDPILRTWGDLPPILVAAALTVAFSAVSWSVFERPLIRLGHRIAPYSLAARPAPR